jgi:hypothetical protein
VRAPILSFALLALTASAARAQPVPAPPPDALQKGLFGEREPEPGDEAVAAGQAEPANPEAPPPASTAPQPSTEAYDARVRQSFAAAESFHGPLDGGWTLSAHGEGQLYAIRFSDNHGKLEAAWRDLRRKGALDASGFVEQADRRGAQLTLRFSPAAGVQDFATLTATANGAWTGELDENGRKRAVTLAKTSP